MMSKGLEKKVDDVDGRVEVLVKLVLEMADDKKKLLKIVEGLQNDVINLTTRFGNIAYACNWKQERKNDVMALPKEE